MMGEEEEEERGPEMGCAVGPGAAATAGGEPARLLLPGKSTLFHHLQVLHDEDDADDDLHI